MQVHFDQYIRNLRIFYQQLSKGHSKQENLNKQFKLLIEQELKKWKKTFGIPKITETTSQNPLLNKIRQNRKNKQMKKFKIDIEYSSPIIQNCIVYAYLYLVFQQKNFTAFEYLTSQLNEPLSKKDIYNPPLLRKIKFAWLKLDQILNGKRKIVRFDKQLQEYYKQIPQVFLDLLYQIITQNIKIVNNDLNSYLEELSKYLSLKIQFFETGQSQAIKNHVYGSEQKFSLKIGHLKQDNIFVNVGKLPQKQEKQVNKGITLEKLGLISTHLNEMYALNMKQYMNLSNLKNRGEFASSGKLSRRNSELKDLSQFNQSNSTSQFTSI